MSQMGSSRGTAEQSFPSDVSTVATARRFVGDTLEAWGADDLSWTAMLLVTELTTNAVLHAGTPYRAWPRPERAPRFTDYAHLARVKEWSLAAEAE